MGTQEDIGIKFRMGKAFESHHVDFKDILFFVKKEKKKHEKIPLQFGLLEA